MTAEANAIRNCSDAPVSSSTMWAVIAAAVTAQSARQRTGRPRKVRSAAYSSKNPAFKQTKPAITLSASGIASRKP
jgi:hypothetical protein